MSIKKHFYVVCNVCGNAVKNINKMNTAFFDSYKEAKAIAEKEGWQINPHDAYCPNCQEYKKDNYSFIWR